MTYQSYTNFR
ncbi:BnaCnng33380D [Brassica napus]|uniref:BnaCnng33380D protein n=1 Tax=Brassica napus TaxID=3708 RepID=A0A078J0G2_BRANA|nr:BnaCnng33380D [Brassica napus]